jgi:hypothetical protein
MDGSRFLTDADDAIWGFEGSQRLPYAVIRVVTKAVFNI